MPETRRSNRLRIGIEVGRNAVRPESLKMSGVQDRRVIHEETSDHSGVIAEPRRNNASGE